MNIAYTHSNFQENRNVHPKMLRKTIVIHQVIFKYAETNKGGVLSRPKNYFKTSIESYIFSSSIYKKDCMLHSF